MHSEGSSQSKLRVDRSRSEATTIETLTSCTEIDDEVALVEPQVYCRDVESTSSAVLQHMADIASRKKTEDTDGQTLSRESSRVPVILAYGTRKK